MRAGLCTAPMSRHLLTHQVEHREWQPCPVKVGEIAAVLRRWDVKVRRDLRFVQVHLVQTLEDFEGSASREHP
jgi:hypothetical protein